MRHIHLNRASNAHDEILSLGNEAYDDDDHNDQTQAGVLRLNSKAFDEIEPERSRHRVLARNIDRLS